MTRRLLVVLVLLVSAGCGTTSDGAAVPDRAPDVTGVVAVREGTPVLTDASDAYFEGMGLLRGDPVVVRGTGEVAADELQPGDAVEVWTGDACAESYPVQCGILAVRLTG